MSERREYRNRLKKMVFAGGVIPEPVELPIWSTEWQPFGDSGDEMKQVPTEEDVSIYLYRARKHTEFPAHQHFNAEMLMVIQGSLTMNFEDRPSELLRVGQSAYIPAEELHSCKFHEDSLIVLAYSPAFNEGVWQAVQKLTKN